MRPVGALVLFVFIALFGLSAQEDPLKDFCRLFGHQTAVVDRKLYIDGGYVNWSPISDSSINYTSTWLRDADLDHDLDNGFPEESILTKNSTVPSVVGGTLWPDTVNKVIYLYGGEYGNGQPEKYGQTWYYDILNDSWQMSKNTASDVQRAAWGAGLAVEDQALGFYYGGWLTNKSVPNYASETALSTLLVYDMIADSFRNDSGPDTTPRAEGSMVYIPTGGGLLIYFGGIEQPYGNSTVAPANMSTIHIYSVYDNKWYTEKATGEVPEARRRFCAGATWSDDRTSYNIYTFGGASVGEGVGFGDTYVLSLPSFKWIKFWPTAEDTNFDPSGVHHSLTCNVIDNAQMIVMGGQFQNSSECDAPSMYGQHGLDLGRANEDDAKWATFNPSLTTYVVPPEITSVIGGNGKGSATVLSPSPTFANVGMAAYFSDPYTIGEASRTATRATTRQTGTSTSSATSSPSKSNKGAIIGGAVGGGIGALILIGAIVFCLKRRSKNKTKAIPMQELSVDSSIAAQKSPFSHASELGSGHTSTTYAPYQNQVHETDGSPLNSTYLGPYGSGSPRTPPQEMPVARTPGPQSAIISPLSQSEKDQIRAHAYRGSGQSGLSGGSAVSAPEGTDNWYVQNAPRH